MLLSIILPIVGALLTAFLFEDTAKSRQPVQPWANFGTKRSFAGCLRMLLPTAAAECAVLLLCNAGVRYLMLRDKHTVPILVMLLCTFLPYCFHYCRVWTEKAQLIAAFKRISVAALVLLAAETFLFNWKSVTAGTTNETVRIENIDTDGSVFENNGVLRVSAGGNLKFNNLPENTNGLILKFTQDDKTGSKRFRITTYMTDDNTSQKECVVRRDYTIGNGTYMTSFTPYQTLYSVRLDFSDVTEPVDVISVRAVSALPFAFSLLRYFLLLGICVICILVHVYQLWQCTVTDKTMLRYITVNAMTLLCVLSALCFISPDAKLTPYDPDYDYSGENPYTQAFDALYDGHAYLNITPDPALETLNNVYDRTEREAADVTYKWDFAYKDGKYYSYFGITPVVTLYEPIYWLTGKIPNLPFANAVFGILAVFFLCMALRALVELLMPQANLMLFLCMMPVSVGTLNLYYMMDFGLSYHLAVDSGLCWLLLCLWLALTACGTKKIPLRLICLGISGIALALCAGSRPSMAICAAILIPLFLGILLRKDENLLFRLGSAVCFAVPLFAGIAGVLWYNNARFGSWLDFGAAYQLTVSDVHANKLDLNLLPEAFYNYFCLTPRPINTFPYFEVEFYDFSNSGKLVYAAPCIGAFAYPLLLLGTLYLPLGWIRKRNAETSSGPVTVLQKNAILLICFAGAICIAWMDYCMGGIIQRYAADFLPLLTIGCVLSILRANDRVPSKFRYLLTIGAAVLTFAMVWLLELELRDSALSLSCPNLYDTVSELMQFWR